MPRIGGWFVLLGGGFAAYLLYLYEQRNARIAGAVNSQAQNLNLPPAAGSPAETAAAIGLSTVNRSSAGQQVGAIVFDPESDSGQAPGSRAQTEAAYNQGANNMGDPFGPDENNNDADGLDAMFAM